MSLKAFHILFIGLSTVLALGFAAWCFMEYKSEDNWAFALAGGLSVITAAGLVLYGIRFARKLKETAYL